MLYDVLMNINPVAFRIGNLEVRWYGLIITCAMVLGLIILIFMAKKKGISSDDTLELFLWVIPLGIVFARVIYVFANNKEYGYFPIESWDDFVNCIAIWDGGITIYGGMVGGVLGALIFCKRKKIKLGTILDMLVPIVLLCQAIGRWGNAGLRRAASDFGNLRLSYGKRAVCSCGEKEGECMTKEMWQLARMHELKDFGERLSHYENDEMLIDEVDEGFCNMMGYTQSELMIRSCGKVGDLIYPPDYEEIRYQIRKNLKQSGSYTCRYRMRKKDGSLIWVWENGRYEKDDTGRKNIRSLVVDVSREEKTMRERDTTYDNIPGGVMTVLVTDTNFYIMEANHQYFTMVGTTREQYLGSSGICHDVVDVIILRKSDDLIALWEGFVSLEAVSTAYYIAIPELHRI